MAGVSKLRTSTSFIAMQPDTDPVPCLKPKQQKSLWPFCCFGLNKYLTSCCGALQYVCCLPHQLLAPRPF